MHERPKRTNQIKEVRKKRRFASGTQGRIRSSAPATTVPTHSRCVHNPGYTYVVVAHDSAGNRSAPSQQAGATTFSSTVGPRFVQVNATTPSAKQSSVSVQYTGPQTTGDLNVIAVGWNDVTSNLLSVTDSSGNQYQVAASVMRGSGLSQAIYYAKNIKAAAAGANSVTVQFDRLAAYIDVRILEYQGPDARNFQ